MINMNQRLESLLRVWSVLVKQRNKLNLKKVNTTKTISLN